MRVEVAWIGLLLATASVSCLQYPTIRIIRNSTGSTEPAYLPCWEVNTKEEVLLWITHKGHIVSSLDNSDHSDKYFITDSGALTVLDGVKEDSGAYRCITNTTMGLSMTDTVLEVVDITFIPEIDDITGNIIRAAVAGGCMAIFFIASCGIYHFRWSPIGNSEEANRRLSTSSGSSANSASSASLRRKSDTSSLTPQNVSGAHGDKAMPFVPKARNGSVKSGGIDNPTFCAPADEELALQKEPHVPKSRNGSVKSGGMDNPTFCAPGDEKVSPQGEILSKSRNGSVKSLRHDDPASLIQQNE